MDAAGAKNTRMCHRTGRLGAGADANASASAADKAADRIVPVLFLMRRVPAFEIVLQPLRSLLWCGDAVDDVGRQHPAFAIRAWRAAREDLVEGSERRLAVLAPARELLRKRIG